MVPKAAFEAEDDGAETWERKETIDVEMKVFGIVLYRIYGEGVHLRSATKTPLNSAVHF